MTARGIPSEAVQKVESLMLNLIPRLSTLHRLQPYRLARLYTTMASSLATLQQEIETQSALSNELRLSGSDPAGMEEVKKKLGELKKSLGQAKAKAAESSATTSADTKDVATKKKDRILLKTAKVSRKKANLSRMTTNAHP